MLDFFFLNIDRREFIRVFPLDFSPTFQKLLKSGWKLEHVLNIHYEGTGFSVERSIENGFKFLISPDF